MLYYIDNINCIEHTRNFMSNSGIDKKLTAKEAKKESKIPKYRMEPFCRRFRKLYDSDKNMYKTYDSLGERIGVTRQAVSNYYNGFTYPDTFILAKIANTFEVSTDYLLGVSEISTTDVETKRVIEMIGLKENLVESLIAMTKNESGVNRLKTTPALISDLFDTDTDEFIYELEDFATECFRFGFLCSVYKARLEDGIIGIEEAFTTINEVADAKALARWRLEKEFSDLLTYNYNYYENEDTEFFKELSVKYHQLTQSK